MHSTLGKRLFSVFIAGCSASLAFAPYYIFPLLIIALSLLISLVRHAQSYKESFLVCWLFGIGYFLCGLYWVAYPLVFYFLGKFWWLAPIALLLGPCLLGIYSGLCGVIMHRLRNLNSIAFGICFACIWTFLEFLRTHLFTGFPWIAAGYSLMKWPALIQSASLFGLFILSFIVLNLSAVLFIFFTSQIYRRIKILSCIGLAGLFIVNALYGTLRLHSHQTILSEYKAKIIQPNLDGLITRQNMDQSANIIIDLARLDGSNEDKLLYTLMPEGALSHFTKKTFDKLVRTCIPKHGYLLSGGDRKEYSSSRIKAWNSMFVFDSRGHVINMYDKFHLVPFGEYIPLRSLLPSSFHAVVAISDGFVDFSKGAGPRTISIAGRFSFCPMICYESLFADNVIESDLLINFTTDMWYKDSTGPYQHFDMSRLRAVEYGIPFIRVATTGISGVVDPYGRVLANIPLGHKGVLLHNIPMRHEHKTLYARFGNSLALFLIGFIFIAAVYFGSKKRFK